MNRWPALLRCCNDGLIEIDNLAAERALRRGATGRRNCLFVGADSGSERVAVIYSLRGTAKLNGVDPEAWLRHVLTHIADHPSTVLTTSCPGIARPSWRGPANSPLPSGVITSSGNAVANSRRCLVDAYPSDTDLTVIEHLAQDELQRNQSTSRRCHY